MENEEKKVEDGLDQTIGREKEKSEDGLDVKAEDSNLAALEQELKEVKKVKDEQVQLNKDLTVQVGKYKEQIDVKLEKLKDPEQYIAKKVAAFEVYKEVVAARNLVIYAIITSLFVAGSAAYMVFIGAIVAGIVAMGFAVMMLKRMQKMKYLEEKYGLQRPKMFKKAN